jgi:hypothetical protein
VGAARLLHRPLRGRYCRGVQLQVQVLDYESGYCLGKSLRRHHARHSISVAHTRLPMDLTDFTHLPLVAWVVVTYPGRLAAQADSARFR